MVTLPPPPVPSRTEALILLFVSRTVPVGFVVIVIFPPLDWLASVVTELFIIVNWFPAFTVMFPALPLPELVAEREAPLLRWMPDPRRLMLPPAPVPTVVVKRPLP